MHVLVVTCAHRGDDARIVHRQARSLLEAGHQVTLIAPAVSRPDFDPEGLDRIDVARASGRHRLGAWMAVRRAAAGALPRADLVLIHDPELVPLLVRRRSRVPIVWDVHEDYEASVNERSYIPSFMRGPATAFIRGIQRRAARRCHVILAEESYAEVFPSAPVVPNSTWVPAVAPPYSPDPRPRAVYVGRISRGRGVDELIALGREMRDRVDVIVIGAADRDVEAALRAAHDVGDVIWRGPLPNPLALQEVRGAAAGLSLLHDGRNYRHSRPTKLIEYLAHGVPVITTPLPLAAELATESGGGEVIDFGDVAAAAAAVDRLRQPRARELRGVAGHRYVAERYNWAHDSRRFVELMERWAAAGR